MLRNAVRSGVKLTEKNVTKIKGSMLLELRGGGSGGQISRNKRYVKLERPPPLIACAW